MSTTTEKLKLEWRGNDVTKAVTAGLRAGVDVCDQKIADAAKGKLSKGQGVDRGKGKRGIKIQKAKVRGGNQIMGAVKMPFALRFLAHGTKAHIIKAKAGKGLAFEATAAQMIGTRQRLYRSKKTGKLVKSTKLARVAVVPQVSHPGVKANYFIEQAFNDVSAQAPGIIRDAVVAQARKAAAAAGSGT